VLIRVHASSLNHEFKMYKLVGNSMTGKGAGWDVAGTVVAVVRVFRRLLRRAHSLDSSTAAR